MSLKVALVLSGQPRSFRKGFEYHKKNLLDRFDVDVYTHSWKTIPIETQLEIAELYKPIYASFSDIYEDMETISRRFQRLPNSQFPAINTYRMFFSLYESFNLIRKHDYDIVVRSRFDFALNIIPPLHETRVNTVYVPSDRMTEAHDFCADMFAWGTYNVMKKYTSVFANMEYLYKKYNLTYIGEDLLAAQLKEEGLTGPNMAYVNMNNPFPPGDFNGNWHSLIRDDFRDWNKER